MSEVVVKSEVFNKEVRYRVTLQGKSFEVEQWDEGKRKVDGCKRDPGWVKIFGRYQ